METSANIEELGFTDLLDIYTTKCEELGKEPDESFKTKEALVDAIHKLEAAPDPAANGGVQAPGGDNSKYSSLGKRGPNQGVGNFAKEQIILGKSNQEILEMIAVKFPTAKTTMPCVAYYRNMLKNGGRRPSGGGKVGDPEQMRAQARDLLARADQLEKEIAAGLTKEAIEAKVREEIEAKIRAEVEARYKAVLEAKAKEEAEKEPAEPSSTEPPPFDPAAVPQQPAA